MRPRVVLWIILILTILALWIDIPPLQKAPTVKILGKQVNFLGIFPLKLGLDLQGGTELVLETQMDKIAPGNRDSALESAKNVLERRVNLYGVSEAIVQTSKLGEQRRILVELPGVKDASSAANLVGKTAQLDFREMPATLSAEEQEATKSGIPLIYLAKPTGLTGADLKNAQVTFGGNQGASSGPQVAIEFTNEGAKKFAEITKRNIGKPLAIFLDDQPVSAPNVQQEIIGGSAVITGQFTTKESKDLAIQLNAGALPVPIKLISQHFIGPTLGQESVNKSLVAGIIGLGVVMIYMAVYYGFLGLIADLALVIYTILVLAFFKTGLFILPPVTLTLAGIAGFILSIGMAVDANILIFERMKEEIRWGKSKTLALDLGFKRAWSSIWASNVSSLMTAAILYGIGTSLIRGFAITLAIGVLVSMFTSYVVTRTLLRLIIK
ncbi:protein-export membrane protein SecD [Candidatus Daviesbacteria bacterium RIFCSPHIGHO2_02_FULL_41_10]|uniref:Protein translocase subunit SecD n=2 Tax=Candidatus Daviesiibacteriota TaxID=1752718 RepID=A0A1F5IRT5_9BACT|nr:MAG: protein-export membrane protein SecD [Candidatus Daviesbacteria bacterium RIFCSPHIGHO2_01_FULL_41_23]OGE33730.1 MAG: protein-export membrane protein SecD [Candidatus Daviesbacteria bacterium RIFCSPHIGHO2_02_FULL_41_10]OGE62180.1 MAG: protein-export membrane protein SecD [Candidatus Daviesbacteria bacterium RIFCSPLOWO2_01_FULL_41_32]